MYFSMDANMEASIQADFQELHKMHCVMSFSKYEVMNACNKMAFVCNGIRMLNQFTGMFVSGWVQW